MDFDTPHPHPPLFTDMLAVAPVFIAIVQFIDLSRCCHNRFLQNKLALFWNFNFVNLETILLCVHACRSAVCEENDTTL